MTAGFRTTFPPGPDDYLAALSRGRWKREFEEPCRGLEGVLKVSDLLSLPVPGSGISLAAAARAHPDADIFAMDSSASEPELRWNPPAASTLREVEAGAGAPGGDTFVLAAEPRSAPARFCRDAGEPRRLVAASGFRVLRVPVTFGVREEILARIPGTARRLLDVGCGAGETAGEARRRNPGLRAAGIDRHPGLADTASRNLDEFFSGDAAEGFAELERRNARFDTIVFADFLEHTEDPYVVLKAALRLAEPGATLIVSVPNAGSLPLVEDLLLGRFDPVAAGPADAGHLRWFTRRLLGELLESVGLREIRLLPVPVPSDGTDFLARLRASGIAHLPDELCAIQWLATAIVPKE